jgi:hypothetical protein
LHPDTLPDDVIAASMIRSRRLAVALWLAVALTCALLIPTDLHRLHTRDTGDFKHFFYAADAVRHGGDPYAAGSSGYIYPPLLAFLAQPVAALGYDRAAAAMLAVNVLVTVFTLTLAAVEFLRRFAAPRRDSAAVAAVVLLALLLDLDKVKGEWQMWQTDVWMLLLMVLALSWLDRRPAWAGFALGVGANLKYLPLLLLPYLLVRRRWTASAALVASSIGLALLPAAQVGWATNGQYWATAVRGLTGMAGAADANAPRAEVHSVADSLSCSVTSALARAGGGPAAFALAGVVAVVLFLAAAWAYRRFGVPMFGRPASPAVTAAEWPVLLAVLLAFSPQTNTRHLYDALLLTSAAAVLILAPTPGVNRWPAVIGMAVLALGFTLPPGHRTVQGFWSPTVAWLRLGGPCWCLLAAAATVLWTALGQARAIAAGEMSHGPLPREGEATRRPSVNPRRLAGG